MRLSIFITFTTLALSVQSANIQRDQRAEAQIYSGSGCSGAQSEFAVGNGALRRSKWTFYKAGHWCKRCAAVPVDEGFCAYGISGLYGPIPRYALRLLSFVFHNGEWAVAVILGPAMLTSSIAAIHAIALAAWCGHNTVGLDVIPVFAITEAAALLPVPMKL
ncbi:uncharacterized protein BDW43DRAFT_315250 [Aspergillus alliaceus]|uniref:uncharacterized protein n=1 Tax=Petromyces alliaceus TaxID=209559 RepID=UPI0012A63FC6|nr:uncharacterized protein BDW43DRAFT_315250 [Aspergillus alliaceus]KAB8229076.1 hypothetical protein BDW43DRAFT_315250 [Aspergillus alliaceus]